MSDWETVIGLEIHCRLATTSKLFCGSANQYGAEANAHVTTVDLGMPGALPVINRQAIAMALCFGLAIEAEIARRCCFARKNYFYPDLPKGYQISQFEQPIVGPGQLTITGAHGREKIIRITRAHLEEDAGKSVHEGFANCTGIDLNRAGTPLLEIVSEPDMRSAGEAANCMRQLHSLVRYLEICDGNMQEGSFRCDANVSVRRQGDTQLGTRTELKNINSFRFVEQAIRYEANRQVTLLEQGREITQETRLYDPARNETRSMRGKEESHDYRYFPDPDLPPVDIDGEWLEQLRQTLPELPEAKKRRLGRDYGLDIEDCATLVAERQSAEYFEACVQAGAPARLAANWVTGELATALKRSGTTMQDCPVPASRLAGMLQELASQTLSNHTARQVFEALWAGEQDVQQIIEQRGLRQVSNQETLQGWINCVLDAHPEQCAQYRELAADKQKKLLGFFVGQVMKTSSGKANPREVKRILAEKLGN